MKKYRIKIDIEVKSIHQLNMIYDDIRYKVYSDFNRYRVALYSIDTYKTDYNIVEKESLIRAEAQPQ